MPILQTQQGADGEWPVVRKEGRPEICSEIGARGPSWTNTGAMGASFREGAAREPVKRGPGTPPQVDFLTKTRANCTTVLPRPIPGRQFRSRFASDSPWGLRALLRRPPRSTPARDGAELTPHGFPRSRFHGDHCAGGGAACPNPIRRRGVQGKAGSERRAGDSGADGGTTRPREPSWAEASRGAPAAARCARARRRCCGA